MPDPDSPAPRRRAPRPLAVLGGLLAFVALLLGGVRLAVGDEGRAADGLAASLRSAPVRAHVGERTAAAVVDARPELVAVEPLLAGAVARAADTVGARAIVRSAAVQLHRTLVAGDEDDAGLVAGELALFAAQAVRARDPAAAARVPPRVRVGLLALRDGPAGTGVRGVARIADAARLPAWGCGALAALLLGAVAIRDRRRGPGRALLAVLLAGVLAAGVVQLVVVLVPLGVDAGVRAAARGLLGAVLEPARALALGVAGVAGLLLLARRSAAGRRAPGTRLRAAGTAVLARPAGRVAAAVGGLLLGGAAVLAPAAVGRGVVVLAGVLLLAVSLDLLVRTLAPQPARAGPAAVRTGQRRRGARGRGRRGPVALGLVLGLAVAAVALLAGRAATPPSAAPTACNGSAALCERRLDAVVLPATHNANAAAADGYLAANQRTGIPAQLAGGIRGLLIDTHVGVRTPRGVRTDLARGTKSRAKLEEAVGPAATRTALRIRRRLTGAGGDPEVQLCHGFCEVGATRAVDALEALAGFLVAHPGEVVVLSVEDGTRPEAFADVVEEAGLLPLVWRGPVAPLPTLGAMVRRDQRVLVLVEEDPGPVPWLHLQRTLAQETPYDLPSASAVLGPRGCAPNRGGTSPPLFLLNAFVAAVPPPIAGAERVNDPATLARLARRCARERGRTANLLAVDFWETGDVVAAAAALNRRPPTT